MNVCALLALTILRAPQQKTYDVNGVSRFAMIMEPMVKTTHPPLVFAFHGHGGNARSAARAFHVEKEWPEAVVVYMQGLPSKGRTDPDGTKNGWQIMLRDLGGRDLAFFDTVFEDVTKRYSTNPDRIYAMGHSNGGRFTYVLWAARGDKFAAFAPSGSPAGALQLAPKPVFHIAGENDPIVDFSSQKDSVERIKSMNGCANEGRPIGDYALFFASKSGNDVVTYYHPDGHTYPVVKGPPMIVDFFKSHPRKH